MKHRFFSAVGAIALFVVGALPASASVYTNGSDDYDKYPNIPTSERNNNWNNKYNWEPEGVPSSEATIPTGETVFLTESVTIETLNLAGGSIVGDGTGDLTVTNTCNWTSGLVGTNGFRNFNIAEGATLK